METKSEILSFHLEGSYNGMPFSCSEISLSIWRLCADKLPMLILGSSLSGKARSEISDNVSVKLEDGSIKFIFLVASSFLATAFASGLRDDLLAISRGDVASVKDRKRLTVFRELEEGLKKVGANRVGVSSRAGNVDEFDLIECKLGEVIDNALIVKSDGYLMAEVENLGGVRDANANLRVLSTGDKVVASTSKKFIASIKNNIIYHKILAHVQYNYNTLTQEKTDYVLLDFSELDTSFDAKEFEESLNDYVTGWNDISDPIAEIRRLRGAHG